MQTRRMLALIAAVVAAMPLSAQAPARPRDLTATPLEELMNVEVTSVSRKEQSLARTPAAVYVITHEDIRRSGATNIPDVLRMAPGVEVAQINATQWAISVRGFNAVFSNKVLVLIDGRTVYNSVFSGVYWDEVDVPLENIERIEVIRGSGGTVWGSNAVNGVINIITLSAADTKGRVASTGVGSKSTGEGFAQYGGHSGSTGAYRVSAKYADIRNSLLSGGGSAGDAWHKMHGGFRSDWRLSDRDTVSVQGDLVTLGAGATTSAVLFSPTRQAAITIPLTDTSTDVLARWDHALKNGSASLQIYDSNTRREQSGTRVAIDVVDLEFQHHVALATRHDIVWGGNYRLTRDKMEPLAVYAVRFTPPRLTYSLFSTFVQDEILLRPSVFLTLGSRFEHNEFTGFASEPSVQLTWAPNARHSLWGSAARAIRQPSRVDRSVSFNFDLQDIPGAGTALIQVTGNPRNQVERVTGYEVGYRAQLTPRLSMDLTSFLTFYSNLQTSEPRNPFVSFTAGAPLLVVPLQFDNLARARSHGVEVFANWKPTNRWKLSPGYSALRVHVTRYPTSLDTTVQGVSRDSPEQQIQLRSLFAPGKNFEWDSSAKYVGGLPDLKVPGYVRVDSRIGWRPNEAMELSITGQNLGSGRHLELLDRSGFYLPTRVSRSVFAKITWRL